MKKYSIVDMMVLTPRHGGPIVHVAGIYRRDEGEKARLVGLDGSKHPEQLLEVIQRNYRPYWLQNDVILTRPGRIETDLGMSGRIRLKMQNGQLLDNSNLFNGFNLATLHDEGAMVRRDTSL